jgi:hypothetical protein
MVSDAFGLKARVMAKFGGKSWWTETYYVDEYGEEVDEDDEDAIEMTVGGLMDNPFVLVFNVLPFFAISDSVTVFADVGINMAMPKEGDAIIGFHFNPYIRVGQEWGPSFFAGVKVWTTGKNPETDKTIINFDLPIGLQVSF